jgi:hypothetical protein
MREEALKQMETAPLTRTEAIRRAIDALGVNAQVPQILDYVWEHFGIGVPPQPAQSPQPRAEEPATGESEASQSPARKGSKRARGKDRAVED